VKQNQKIYKPLILLITITSWKRKNFPPRDRCFPTRENKARFSNQNSLLQGFNEAQNKMNKTEKKIAEQLEEIRKELGEARYGQGIILSALRNLLAQNNPNGVNDYIINIVDRAR